MEISKNILNSYLEKCKATSQITLDDDYNVPDYRPDIVKVLKEQGELAFDEVSVLNGAVWVKGRMIFHVLYRSEQENAKISSLRGEISFQEKINIEGVQEHDVVSMQGEIEDLNIGVIHSRKLSVRAVVTLLSVVGGEERKEVCAGIGEEDNCQQKIREQETLILLYGKKDRCKQRNEIVLPSSKPNVQEILWKSIEVRNLTTHVGADGIVIAGEILMSILYSEEEEPDRIQWYETVVPLDCMVPCELPQKEKENGNGLLHKIIVEPESREVEVKPDYDGEERMLVMELGFQLDIRIWKEEKIPFLEDAYALDRELVLQRMPVKLESLLVKNESQCRLTERLVLPDNQERILQICTCEGIAKIEHAELRERGMWIEGVLMTELLYITTDDKMPVGVVKEVYPFEQTVEIPVTNSRIRTELECGISQLSAVMLDQEHVEIRATVELKLLAFSQNELSNIVEIQEEIPDMEALSRRPGLVGYVAKTGDLIWNIAKENHTTVEQILQYNQRKDGELKPGEKLLIVKNI